MVAPPDAAPATSVIERRLPILLPLRHRGFRWLWAGMTVSLLGDGITMIAIAWQAYEISNVPSALAVVGVAQTIPHVLLLLIGGAVSDRFERRKVMIFADSVRCVAVAALALLATTGALEIWHMMLIAALYGVGSAFFGPAFDAVVPELVPDEDLAQANALDQFVRPAVFRMLGPACGGWIIAAFGGRAAPAFALDAVTFLVSIACLSAIGRQYAPAPDEQTAGSLASEIGEGLRYVVGNAWLWATFLAATLAYLVFWGPAEVLLPFIVKEEMHRSAGELGFVFAFGGIGAMFAALIMSSRAIPRRNMTFMYVAWTISTLMVALYGLAKFPWQLMVASFAFNALESAGLIVWVTTKQRLIPGRLLGRVSSLDWCISIGLVPVSFALTGPIAGVLGARTTLVVAGLAGACITLGFLFVPGVRAIEVGANPPETSDPRPEAALELETATSV
jgi:DHA3 family tetracycline resistance protein-like MFS transporter